MRKKNETPTQPLYITPLYTVLNKWKCICFSVTPMNRSKLRICGLKVRLLVICHGAEYHNQEIESVPVSKILDFPLLGCMSSLKMDSSIGVFSQESVWV